MDVAAEGVIVAIKKRTVGECRGGGEAWWNNYLARLTYLSYAHKLPVGLQLPVGFPDGWQLLHAARLPDSHLGNIQPQMLGRQRQ